MELHDVMILVVAFAARTARALVDPATIIFAALCGVLGLNRVSWLWPVAIGAGYTFVILLVVNNQREGLGLIPISFATLISTNLLIGYTLFVAFRAIARSRFKKARK